MVGRTSRVAFSVGAGVIVAAGTRVWTLDEPVRRTAEDALDLVRMDDDGGWQVATPSTECHQPAGYGVPDVSAAVESTLKSVTFSR